MKLDHYFQDLSGEALAGIEAVLRSPGHPQFEKRFITLLSRCDNPKELFALVSREFFREQWPRIRRVWRKLRTGADFLAYWDTVARQLNDVTAGPRGLGEEARWRDVGASIRTKREQRGWTQAELARRAGMSQPDISAIEQGKKNLTLETLQRLTRLLPGEPTVKELILPWLPPDLEDLFTDENQVRTQAILHINSIPEMKETIEQITYSLMFLYKFVKEYREKDPEELAVLMLGTRMFNTGAMALRLTLAGYYQGAVMLLRDLLETQFLLEYLILDRKRIAAWRAADSRTFRTEFRPAKIRKALDQHHRQEGKLREMRYQYLSVLGAHPTWESFQLMGEKNHIKVGPFYNEELIQKTMGELSISLYQSVGVLAAGLSNYPPAVSAMMHTYAAKARPWWQKVQPGIAAMKRAALAGKGQNRSS